MKKIVIVNNKGGVGKTTVASQLAFHLAESGFSVVALDLDGQRNLTTALQGQKVAGSSLDMISSGEAPEIAAEQGEVVLISGDADIPVSTDDEVLRLSALSIAGLDGADFCIIDTPPTFSAVVYGALVSADYMLSPIELKRFSLDGVEGVVKAFFQIQEINPDIAFLGLLPSRYDAVKKSERDMLRLVASQYAELIIPHAIHNRVAYEAAGAEGLHIKEVNTASGKVAAAEFQAFFDWFREAVDEGKGLL